MKIDLKGKVERKGQVNFVVCFKDSEDIYRTVLDNICILLSQSNRQADISWNKELESSFGSKEVKLIKHGDRLGRCWILKSMSLMTWICTDVSCGLDQKHTLYSYWFISIGLLVGLSSFFLQLQTSNAWKSLLEDQIYVNLWNKWLCLESKC